MFLSFKAEKAKKATLVASSTNLQTLNFVKPKILLYDPKELFESLFDQNKAGSCMTKILKAKMGLGGQNFFKNLKKNCKLQLIAYRKVFNFCFTI